MNGYTGLHHLAFVTNNLEKTVRFWRDLLGMRLVHSHGRPGYRQYYFEVSPDNLITFFEWPGVEKMPIRRHGEVTMGRVIFDHISIGVEDTARLQALTDILIGADLPVSDIVDHGFFRSIYTYDPNGISVEFSCDVPGVDVRSEPVLADSEPPKVRLEGTEPRPQEWPEPDRTEHDEPPLIIRGDGYDLFH
ncbi:MAG: VOC family protein [Magnetococcales bacterium]|nr:VOC family protein [Magnetococcales bacterium]